MFGDGITKYYIFHISKVAYLFCFVSCISRKQVLSFGDKSREVCRSPLGLESGEIKDSQLRAPCHPYEIYLGDGHHADARPRSARLNGVDAWCCLQRNMNGVHLTIDLENVMIVSGMATQGIEGVLDYYVKKYSIQTSVNGSYWEAVYSDQNSTDQVWNGNSDGLGTVTNMFRTPLEARFIQIHPLDYKSKMCLRLELYGCKKKNITSTPYPSSTPTVLGSERKNYVHPTRHTAISSSQPVRRSTVTKKQKQTTAPVTTSPLSSSALTPTSVPLTTEVVVNVAARGPGDENTGRSEMQTYQVFVIVTAAVVALIGVIMAAVFYRHAHTKRNAPVVGLTARCTSQTSLAPLHGYSYSQVIELKNDCSPEEEVIAV